MEKQKLTEVKKLTKTYTTPLTDIFQFYTYV